MAKVQEIDTVASHASWMENFPWTRLAGVKQPTPAEADDRPGPHAADAPKAVRDYLGDGNFGGYYERPDEDMLAIWEVAVEETRALLEGALGMSEPILIWGAGAIGGTLGAAFIRAGHDVLFVDREADHVAAINAAGLQHHRADFEDTVTAPAFVPDDLKGRFDRIFLCVKAQDTRGAAQALAAASRR